MIPLHDENPTRQPAYLIYTLIGINALVFVAQLALGHMEAVYRYGIIPVEVLQGARELYAVGPREGPVAVRNFEPAWVTLFTSMFMHGGWLHLIGNMWFLAIFGNNIEDRLGRGRFIFFYLACGVAAALTHIFTNPQSSIPTIGASGAIAGVLGAYFVLYPGSRITTLIFLGFIITTWVLPASVVLGFWFLLQVFNGVMGWGMTGDQGGVAYGAHIGGFVAGWLLIRLLAPPPPRRPRYYGPSPYWPRE